MLKHGRHVGLKAIQQARRKRRAELIAMGWKSTGDVPYDIAPEVPELAAMTISSRMRRYINTVVSKESDKDYREKNVEMIDGRNTFISPDLIEKIRLLVKEEVRNRPQGRVRFGRRSSTGKSP